MRNKRRHRAKHKASNYSRRHRDWHCSTPIAPGGASVSRLVSHTGDSDERPAVWSHGVAGIFVASRLCAAAVVMTAITAGIGSFPSFRLALSYRSASPNNKMLAPSSAGWQSADSSPRARVKAGSCKTMLHAKASCVAAFFIIISMMPPFLDVIDAAMLANDWSRR